MATVLILIQNKHSNIIYVPNIIRRLMLCHAFPVYTFSPHYKVSIQAIKALIVHTISHNLLPALLTDDS